MPDDENATRYIYTTTIWTGRFGDEDRCATPIYHRREDDKSVNMRSKSVSHDIKIFSPGSCYCPHRSPLLLISLSLMTNSTGVCICAFNVYVYYNIILSSVSLFFSHHLFRLFVSLRVLYIHIHYTY